MATVYSTQRTNSRATPAVMNKANELSGRIRVAHGVYEASSLASGDVIEMFALPDGARILQGQLAHDALGSSTTLSVGFAAHSKADGTAVSASAAAYKAAAASTSAQIVDIAATLALLNFSYFPLCLALVKSLLFARLFLGLVWAFYGSIPIQPTL